MRNSTLRKLPIPFMAACGLGIGTIGMMLFGKNDGTDVEQTAKVEVDEKSKSVSLRHSSNGTRYRTGNVAKLNRPGGNNYRPVRRAGTQVAETKTPLEVYSPAEEGFVPKLTPPGAAVRNEPNGVVNETAETANEVDTRLANTEATHESEAIATQVTTADSQTDGTKTETVAARLNPYAGSNKYSTQKTDPSQALSEALEENSEPIDVVMPETEPEDVVSPEPESVVSAQQETTELEAPEAAESANGELKPSTEKVVAGELTPDNAAQAKISIQNPSENKLPVWFVVKQSKIQLKPGQKFVCPARDDLQIRFARGGDFGVEKLAISEGTWRFSVSRKEGWRLNELD